MPFSTSTTLRAAEDQKLHDSTVPASTCGSGAVMKMIIGVVLIVLGLVGLAWGGFHYKTEEKVLDIGPVHATREKTHSVPVPPIAGAVALVGGIALVVVSRPS